MLSRITSFYEWFQTSDVDRQRAEQLIQDAMGSTKGMMDRTDFEALAASLIYYQPKKIFEIGTYLGVTTNFMCQLLPTVEIVTIAYVRPRIKWLGKKYNNSGLSKDEVGKFIKNENRSRVTQLYGDSHKINVNAFRSDYTEFDWILIDGDHTLEGVRQDTLLAQSLISKQGSICWHDANPREKYIDVKDYLEKEIQMHALATNDTYIGGIAVWNKDIETRLAGTSA